MPFHDASWSPAPSQLCSQERAAGHVTETRSRLCGLCISHFLLVPTYFVSLGQNPMVRAELLGERKWSRGREQLWRLVTWTSQGAGGESTVHGGMHVSNPHTHTHTYTLIYVVVCCSNYLIPAQCFYPAFGYWLPEYKTTHQPLYFSTP